MAQKKFNSNEMRLIVGGVLILVGLLGLGNIISILLIIFGGYLIYEGLKK